MSGKICFNLRVLSIYLLLFFNICFAVDIVEEENIILVPEKQKVKILKEGFIILEYPNYQLVIDVKNSGKKEVHLKCSFDMKPFLQSCGSKLIKGLPKKQYKYYRISKDKIGICGQEGIYLYKNEKVEKIIEYSFPSFIEDCSFSPDGKFAVYSFNKNYFQLLFKLLTLGKAKDGNYLLKEIEIKTKREKTLLKGYLFSPFYNPIYSKDLSKIYFSTDSLENIREKGLFSYNRKTKKAKYEIYFTAPVMTYYKDKLLICDIKDIYLYDPKKQEKFHIYRLDRNCPEFIYYTEEIKK